MKKIISLVLALCMILAAVPSYAFDDSIAYGFSFRTEGDRFIITGIATNSQWLTIPASVNGMEVDIEYNAFSGNTVITSVTFEYGWKRIPMGACRNMTNLEKVTIPATVEEIGDYAFSGTAIGEVNITNAVTIGAEAFSECVNLADVRIPETVKTIGEGAFRGCTSLESIHLENTRALGKSAFANCTALRKIDHNGKIRAVGTDCFEGCGNLSDMTASDLVTGYKIDADKTVIPSYEEVAIRPDGAYFSQGERSSNNYRYEVRRYANGEEYAYILEFPASKYRSYVPETIDGYRVLYGGSYYQDGFYYYSDNNRLPHATIMALPDHMMTSDTLVVPNSIDVEIVVGSAYGWADTAGYTKFDLSMYFDLPEQILANCRKVEEVILNPYAETISERAFAGDINLKHIELPDTMREIGAYAFYGAGLESITIPKGTTYIGESAFEGCNSLKEVVIEEGETLVVDSDAFENIAPDAKIYIYREDVRTKNDFAGYEVVVNYSDKNTKPISIFVNGKKLECDVMPYIKDGRTMVPMRAIFEALGASVNWYNNEKTATGTKDGVEIAIKIGNKVLYKNGEGIAIDAAAEIKDGRTMVPVRAISEAFGCNVKWIDETREVHITEEEKLTKSQELLFSKYFQDDKENAKKNMRVLNQSIENEDYVLTVNDVVGNASSMYLTVTVTAKNAQAKDILMREEFDWIKIEGSKGDEKWFGFDSGSLSITDNDSRIFLYSCTSSLYGSAPRVRVGWKRFADNEYVHFEMEEELDEIKLYFDGLGVVSAYIIIQPMRIELMLPTDDTTTTKPAGNLDTYFRMKDGSIKTLNQIAGFNSSASLMEYEFEPKKFYKYVMSTKGVLDLGEFESVIVMGNEYSIKDAPKYTTNVEVPENLKPFKIVTEPFTRNGFYYLMPIEPVLEKVEAEYTDKGEGFIEFVYNGKTYKLEDKNKTVYVNGEAAYTLQVAPYIHTDGKMWVNFQILTTVLGIKYEEIENSNEVLVVP